MTQPHVGPRTKEEAGCGASGTTAWCGDGTILAWNAVLTGRDGVPAGGTTGVTVRDSGAATNKVPRAHEEAGCGAATGAMEWGGVDATVACTVVVAGRDAASAGWSTG